MTDRHKESSHIRILMRQEKTMKIIANHVLDYRIQLLPNVGAADRSWVWTAFDFAEGTLVEKVCGSFLNLLHVLIDFCHQIW
jgi:Ran-binding protein 1